MAPKKKVEQQLETLQKTVYFTLGLVVLLVLTVGYLFVKVQSKGNVAQEQIAAGDQFVSPAPEEQFPIIDKYPALTKNDYVRGDPKAKFVLIEYSDYECPFCKRFHESVLSFLENHNGTAFVYRHFPLEQLHQQAKAEAIAAECAGKIGGSEAFWQFTDAIFTNTTSNDGLDLTQLPTYAAEAGVDLKAFQNCYDNEETATRVQKQAQDGAKYGVQGTPGSFLINTETKKAVFIPGALPPEQLEVALDKIK